MKNSGPLKAYLKEVIFYAIFPNYTVVSKLSTLKFTFRPRTFVLTGASEIYNVFVCAHHENVDLMLAAVNIQKATHETDPNIITHHERIKKIAFSEKLRNVS